MTQFLSTVSELLRTIQVLEIRPTMSKHKQRLQGSYRRSMLTFLEQAFTVHQQAEIGSDFAETYYNSVVYLNICKDFTSWINLE